MVTKKDAAKALAPKNVELYDAVERVLRAAAGRPVTVGQLNEREEVRSAAKRPGQSSDVIVSLLQKNLIRKVPWKGPGPTKFAYVWSGGKKASGAAPVKPQAKPAAVASKAKAAAGPSAGQRALGIRISQDGRRMSFSLSGFAVTVEIAD